ncbi:MAG: hypothetical protein KDA32_03715 [Phycisphaerales bacterium]|nr:hypothetical protein [Phycisphaerales bacterium]
MEVSSATLPTPPRPTEFLRRDGAEDRIADHAVSSTPTGQTGPPVTDRVVGTESSHDAFGRPHGEADLAGNETPQRPTEGGSIQDEFRAAIQSADRAALERIESRLRDIVDIAPGATPLQRMLAEAQRRLGKTREAARTTQAVVDQAAIPPRKHEAEQVTTLPPFENTAHENADATANAEDSTAERPGSTPQVENAKRALERGEVIVALRDFEQALAEDPDNVEAKRGVAEAHRRRAAQSRREGDLEAAKAELALTGDATDQ